MDSVASRLQAGHAGDVLDLPVAWLKRHIQQSMAETLQGRTYEERRDLSRKIREHGIQVPLELGRGLDRYQLVDGHQRLIIAENLGMETVPVLLGPGFPLSAEAGPSWRAMTDEPFWTQYDTVIVSNAGPRPSYEVFIRGRQVATRDRLDDAKTFVEKEYGPLQWSRKRLDKMEVTHRFFGPTTEFGEAATIHVSDLPRIRGVAVRVPNNSIGYGAGHDNLPEVSDQLPLRTRGSSLPRGVGGHDGPPSADGQPPRRDVVAGRDGLPEHGSLSRTASRLSPSDVSGWASSRPWMATKAEVEMSSVGYLYVLSRAKSSGHMASFDTGSGRIGVTSAYFEVAEDSRRAILYHEAGHALEVAAGMAGIAKAFGVANALDILSLPGADRFGYNASEIAAQAYSVLWTEPQWASFPGGAEILAAGARLARDHGWPIPSGAKTASDYEMDHRPLEDAAPMHDLSATFPDDVYDHPEYYSFGEWTAEAGRVLRQAKGKPDAQVAIYRALPAGETRINTGDWVTTVRSYAALHLQKMERGRQWHIVSATVPARTLRTGGNDIIEWGYWGSPVGARVASLDNQDWLKVTYTIHTRRPGQSERSYDIDHKANPYWYTDIEGAIDGTIKGKVGSKKVGSAESQWWEESREIDGIEYRWGGDQAEAVDGSETVGWLWLERGPGSRYLVVDQISVKPEYQRRGIASNMLAFVREMVPIEIRHSDNLSPAGRAWSEKVGSKTADWTRRQTAEVDGIVVELLHGSDDASVCSVVAYLDYGKTVPMGELRWVVHGGQGVIDSVMVKGKYRRQGVATKMLEFARSTSSVPIVHSKNLYPDGKAWSDVVGSKTAERTYEEEIEHFLAEAKASGKADFGSTDEAKRFLEPIVGRYDVRIQVSHKNPDGTLGLGAKAWVYKDGGQWVLNLRPEHATKDSALHEAAHIIDVETNGWPEGGVSRMIDMKQSWAHGPRFQEVLQGLQRFGSLRTRGKAITTRTP